MAVYRNGVIGTASATTSGVVELATSAETITGTDTARGVTPAGLAATLENDAIGIGAAYDNTFGTEPTDATRMTARTLTDVSDHKALSANYLKSIYTSNSSKKCYAQRNINYIAIETGVTVSTGLYGQNVYALRNYLAADTDDSGTMNTIYANYVLHGHLANNAAATPVSQSSAGLYVKGYCKTGTFTGNFHDIWIQDDMAGGTVTGLHYGIKQETTTAVNYFGGQMNLNNYVVQKVTVTTDNTDGVDTYTAAQMLGRLIRRGTGDELTGAVVDVTDTAANIVAAILDCKVGSSFEFVVQNEDSTHTIQVDGGTGVTMLPNDPSTAIPANSSGRFLVVATNVTASSEAVTIHCIGITGH